MSSFTTNSNHHTSNPRKQVRKFKDPWEWIMVAYLEAQIVWPEWKWVIAFNPLTITYGVFSWWYAICPNSGSRTLWEGTRQKETNNNNAFTIRSTSILQNNAINFNFWLKFGHLLYYIIKLVDNREILPSERNITHTPPVNDIYNSNKCKSSMIKSLF